MQRFIFVFAIAAVLFTGMAATTPSAPAPSTTAPKADGIQFVDSLKDNTTYTFVVKD